MMTSWNHLDCKKKPKGLTSIDQIQGMSAIKPDDKAKVEAWFASSASALAGSGKKRSAADSAAAASSSTGGGGGAVDLPPTADLKKMKAADLKAALASYGLGTGGKKAEQVAALEEVAKKRDAAARYSAMSAAALKDLLGENNMKKAGDKDELIERCVDGYMYGQLPRCPECGAGRLRVRYLMANCHGGQGAFSCPGYYDDDAFKRCGYSATSVTRPPWVEGGAAVAPTASTGGGGGGGGAGSGSAAPPAKKSKKATPPPPPKQPEVRMPGDDD